MPKHHPHHFPVKIEPQFDVVRGHKKYTRRPKLEPLRPHPITKADIKQYDFHSSGEEENPLVSSRRNSGLINTHFLILMHRHFVLIGLQMTGYNDNAAVRSTSLPTFFPSLHHLSLMRRTTQTEALFSGGELVAITLL